MLVMHENDNLRRSENERIVLGNSLFERNRRSQDRKETLYSSNLGRLIATRSSWNEHIFHIRKALEMLCARK